MMKQAVRSSMGHSSSLNTDGGKLRNHSLYSQGAGYFTGTLGLKIILLPRFLQEIIMRKLSMVIYEQSVKIVI